MTKLILPIPSPVPLSVLAMPIATLLERVPTEGPCSTTIVTRLGNVCQNNGIEAVWTLAINSRKRFLKLKNCKDGNTNLAEKALESVGCSFGMFQQLRETIDAVAVQARKTLSQEWISDLEVCKALAGIGDWAKIPKIVAALAEFGLRPNMPIEELFVYDPTLAEPKKLTVAEELLRFGAMDMKAVFDEADLIGFAPDARVIEILALLAVCDIEETRVVTRARQLIFAAAQKHLSPEAMKKLAF